jgi:alkanesulfonate monooxygenase SsuD/methylene tetrahydromethanopterin reductase-like flavin-dependent oxidoreductase (luciferase family)
LYCDFVSLGDYLPDPHSGRYNQTQAERIRSLVEMGVRAEELGFGAVWYGEHHSCDYLMPAPQMLLAAVAERTEQIRLGTAVSLLQTNDPVRLAEDFATLDLLSGGRAEIGFASGISRLVYHMFNQSPDQAAEIGLEHLDLLRRLWNEPRVSWTGRFRTPLEGVRCTPSTYSGREIPIHLGATRSLPNAIEAGRRGLKLMLGTVIGAYADYRPLADAYREEYVRAGHDPAQMCVSIIALFHLDEDGDLARRRWRPYLDHYIAFRVGQLLSADSMIQLPPLDGPPPRAEAEMAGSPDEVVDQLLRAVDDVGGADRVQCGIDMGALPVEQVFHTMELFAEGVMPKVAEL